MVDGNEVMALGCLSLVDTDIASSYTAAVPGWLGKHSTRIYKSINYWPPWSAQQARALVSHASPPILLRVIYQAANLYSASWQPGCEGLSNLFHLFLLKMVAGGPRGKVLWSRRHNPLSLLTTENVHFVLFSLEHNEARLPVTGSSWVYFTAFILFPRTINETLSALMTTMTFLDHVIAPLAHLLLSHALMDEFGYVNNLYIIWS